MNHVELSGLIAEPVVAHKVNEQIVHAEFQLQTRHKNRAGEWQKKSGTPSTAGIVWQNGSMRICIRAIL